MDQIDFEEDNLYKFYLVHSWITWPIYGSHIAKATTEVLHLTLKMFRVKNKHKMKTFIGGGKIGTWLVVRLKAVFHRFYLVYSRNLDSNAVDEFWVDSFQLLIISWQISKVKKITSPRNYIPGVSILISQFLYHLSIR